jgi:hypothetical protein
VTLQALSEALAARGLKVHPATVGRFLGRERKSLKKTVLPAEQVRPDVARRRRRWIHYRDRIDPRRLVFIDETWIILRQAQDQHGAASRMRIGLAFVTVIETGR